jgi:hypothetical protein
MYFGQMKPLIECAPHGGGRMDGQPSALAEHQQPKRVIQIGVRHQDSLDSGAADGSARQQRGE